MNPKAWLTFIAAALTVVLGLWGFFIAFPQAEGQPEWLRWFDNLYRTIRLFVMEGDPGDSEEPIWQLTLARAAATLTVFATLLWLGYRRLRDGLRRFLAGRFYRSHHVICGLGERGQALARDLLADGKRVVVVDREPQPLHLEAIASLGAAFIHGDATQEGTLRRAGVSRAAHVVTLTDNDSVNFGILSSCQKIERSDGLQVHLHLTERESRALLEQGGPFAAEQLRVKGILVSAFNLYDLAAAELFQRHPLGANVDTVSASARPVSVLIEGFGRMGQAVLLDAMGQGHFCNGVPIRLLVVVEDSTRIEQRFNARFREVAGNANGAGLDLWELRFVDVLPADETVASFSNVIAAHDDSNVALASILRLLERYRLEAGPDMASPQPLFAYHAGLAHPLCYPALTAFGEVSGLCRADTLIDHQAELACRLSHADYARTKLGSAEARSADDATLQALLKRHDAQEQDPNKWLLWEHLPLYKRRSNLAEKRHIPIKLQALGLDAARLAKARRDDTTVLPFDLPYVEGPAPRASSAGRLAGAALDAGLDQHELLQRLHALARAEHARWNAFHVLDNWRYGPSKDERLRTHDCLLDWNALEKMRPDVLQYDYQNVYQIPKTLDLIG